MPVYDEALLFLLLQIWQIDHEEAAAPWPRVVSADMAPQEIHTSFCIKSWDDTGLFKVRIYSFAIRKNTFFIQKYILHTKMYSSYKKYIFHIKIHFSYKIHFSFKKYMFDTKNT